MPVLGQNMAREQLQSALGRGVVSHAYLFLGPPGVGKKTAARWFAAGLVCETPDAGAGEPCGACRSCRLAEAGAHPDIVWLEPAGATLKIDQVRGLLREAAYQSARAGGRRVFVIAGADRMTGEAANALLKNLEEPAPGEVFILTAVNRLEVLPTIQSRCRLIRFGPLPPAVVETILLEHGVPAETAVAAGRLAEGSAGRALALAQDPGIGQVFARVRECLEMVRSREEAGLLRLAAELEKSPYLEAVLQELAACYRDALVWLTTGDSSIFSSAPAEATGGKDLIAGLARSGPANLARAYREIQLAWRRLHQNVNKRLCLDVLFLFLAELPVVPPVEAS